VKTQYKEIYELWRERPDLAKIPDGESLQEARQRSLKALNKIIADCKQGTIVIVTHRVITKLLECALLGLDDSHFWNIEQDTCGVTTFLYNGRIFVLKYHNDISFLKNH
jgi:broad specificity phosphatase PhoE